MNEVQLPIFTVEDALARTIAWLRDSGREPTARHRDSIAKTFNLQQVLDAVASQEYERLKALYPRQGITVTQFNTEKNDAPFHTAAWELVRRGVVRPIARKSRPGESAPEFGWLFATTDYGIRWLSSLNGDEAIPMEYGRFAELLAGYTGRFGEAYHARSQEAVRCYQARAYLACCAMCGAAAESILLRIAFARTGDEQRIIKDYRSGGGRGRLERLIAVHLSPKLKDSLTHYMDLLKYWRDDSAHGADVTFDEEAAFTAMLLLLRLGRFASREWVDLSGG